MEQLERDAAFRLAGPLHSRGILEIGCGDGDYSIAASTKKAQVAAVDISASMLSSARRRAEGRGGCP
jgi:ubiquinone/menaquinone biosynthesis C-methylase UbiE